MTYPKATPAETRRLQRACNRMGARLTVDGVFGPKTAAAVLEAAVRLARVMPQLETP